MVLQIEKYDMQVLDVVSVEFKPIQSAKKDAEGNWKVYSWFGLRNLKGRLVWDDNLDIPRDVISAGEELEAGPQTLADVNKINTWLASIGAPEIKVKLDQTPQVIVWVEEPQQ